MRAAILRFRNKSQSRDVVLLGIGLRELGVVSLLLILTLGTVRLASAQEVPIPFDGLKLVYFAETTQDVEQLVGIYASSWITILFHDVTDFSSKMEVSANGTITQSGQQRFENLTKSVDFPTDRDTLLFLRNAGQDNLTIYAGPSGLTIPSLPGLTIDLTKTWNLHDKPLIRTPVGSFPGYRYHTSMKSIPLPTEDTVDLDFYASYEENTQVLMAGEVWATYSGVSKMIGHTDLKETNLLSSIPASRCLIATATYGSEFAPQVQFLREFRDQKILKTFVGSSFMAVFNLWYYSFSPAVARVIHSNPSLGVIMQTILYPLIAILEVSAALFGALDFQPEIAALLAGLAASGMIGVIYVSLPSILLCRHYRKQVGRLLRLMISLLGIGMFAFGISEVAGNSLLAALSSVMIVLSNLSLFAALPSAFLNRRIH